MNEIVGAERDALILSILNRIDADPQRIASPERTVAWQNGWAEALAKFRANPVPESLVPAFIRSGQPVRSEGRFWHAPDGFELAYVRKLQQTFLAHAVAPFEAVYEFGCGTGFNLAALATLYPGKSFCGFDFVPAAVELVREVGVKLGIPIGADLFDMLNPPAKSLAPDACVFTFGAIEQLASRFQPFIEYLLTQRPGIVCHVEPIIELYDQTNLVDALAIRFHRKRGYTEGLLPYLQAHPDIEVLSVERAYFGSMMFEGYGRIVWQPK